MPLPVDDQLCFALYNASRAMMNAYAPILDDLGLTYPQYLVMLVLWEEDGPRVSRLGERLSLDSATLTPLIKRLEAHGVVRRQRSTLDERVVEVFLTAKGKQMKKKADAVGKCFFDKTGLSGKDALALRDQINALTSRLRAA
jgi:DNA-binding MarR family transcriptional regulator